MKGFKLFRILCITFITLTITAVNTKAVEKLYPIPGHGMIKLDIPDDLETVYEQNKNGGPPAIFLKTINNEGYGMLVIVSWRKPDEKDFGSDDHLKKSLMKSVRLYLDQLKLDDIPIEHLSGSKNPGYACLLIDKAALENPPKQGDFPYLRQGVIRNGDLLLSYTVFMYSIKPDPVPRLESILQNSIHIDGKNAKH